MVELAFVGCVIIGVRLNSFSSSMCIRTRVFLGEGVRGRLGGDDVSNTRTRARRSRLYEPHEPRTVSAVDELRRR